MLDFSVLNTGMANPTAVAVIYGFLLSFVLGSIVAFVYIKSFQGLSYSRNFVHCLVLCPILTAIAMQAIGDNIARGIGMIGAISILRFRTNIKDPRDMFFVFASLAIGLAAGVHAYSVAVFGALAFALAIFVLSKTPFSQGPQFDGLLKLNMTQDQDAVRALETTLVEECRNYALISLREIGQGDRLDYTYQIKLRPAKSSHTLVQSVSRIPGARGVNLMLQEAIVEV
jgi:uncharacterized membrane protein YhiD involved in acid resistance